jgi:hypothetical protein
MSAGLYKIFCLLYRENLLKGGAKEDKIQIKIADCGTESSVSDKILEELNSG